MRCRLDSIGAAGPLATTTLVRDADPVYTMDRDIDRMHRRSFRMWVVRQFLAMSNSSRLRKVHQSSHLAQGLGNRSTGKAGGASATTLPQLNICVRVSPILLDTKPLEP